MSLSPFEKKKIDLVHCTPKNKFSSLDYIDGVQKGMLIASFVMAGLRSALSDQPIKKVCIIKKTFFYVNYCKIEKCLLLKVL